MHMIVGWFGTAMLACAAAKKGAGGSAGGCERIRDYRPYAWVRRGKNLDMAPADEETGAGLTE